jgi:hypothetical protein
MKALSELAKFWIEKLWAQPAMPGVKPTNMAECEPYVK